ncbi:hypothetical protein EZV62_003102 [Acer yangbiense]|uniref:Uncharacterized protein n=1 Tax=Acer yangbiense TaxID=1000413 RepID=A0A5C7IFT7_9ROSI|nr:hypothetical protein EZV62_003102 [Acer yangbiense]
MYLGQNSLIPTCRVDHISVIDKATLDCLQVRGGSDPRFLDHDPHVLVSVGMPLGSEHVFLARIRFTNMYVSVLENSGCIAEYKVNGTGDEAVDVELAIGVDVEGASIVSWREVKGHLLQVDTTMERSSFPRSILISLTKLEPDVVCIKIASSVGHLANIFPISEMQHSDWTSLFYEGISLQAFLDSMVRCSDGQQSYHSSSVNTSAAESNVWQRHLLHSIVRKLNLSRHLFILTTWNINTAKLIKQAMMKKCPSYRDYEASDYGVHEFDPQLDFSQFLEEARQHAKEVNFEASSTYTEEIGKKKQLEGEKKIKKSWKNSLLSWWKVHKKSKPSMEPAASTNISNPRKGHVSGPIYGSGRGDEMKLRRPTSGPITNLFNPINTGEDEIPYMCLDQINNNSHHVKSYGPVYLVT